MSNLISKLTFCFGPRIPGLLAWLLYSIWAFPGNLYSAVTFLFNPYLYKISFFQKFSLLLKFYRASLRVHCLHQQSEMIKVASAILSLPPDLTGCVVEAGTYKGGSAIKLSLACRISGRKLMVFDSFAGLPEDDEFQCQPSSKFFPGDCAQKSKFSGQNLCGSLEEVKDNVKKFGAFDNCQFVRGWFKDTLPDFKEKIAVIYLDVDLASSVKTCLKYLYPLLEENGVIFSHDGCFFSVIKLFNDNRFWEDTLGVRKPLITGLNKDKLIKIVKTTKAQ